MNKTAVKGGKYFSTPLANSWVKLMFYSCGAVTVLLLHWVITESSDALRVVRNSAQILEPLTCLDVNRDTILNRQFEYNGTHCSFKYDEASVTDVFESHRSEWAHFGRTQAWWSVLTDDRWKGMKDIPLDVKNNFYKSSDSEATDLLSQLKRFNVKERGLALDFGCGVGRLSMMLHKTLGYKKVIGIDQSVWHAIIARHEMMIRDPTGKCPIWDRYGRCFCLWRSDRESAGVLNMLLLME